MKSNTYNNLYFISSQAITATMPHINKVIGFNMDDVLFTGILADLANVTRADHKEMFRVGNGVNNKLILKFKWIIIKTIFGLFPISKGTIYDPKHPSFKILI